MARLLKNAFLVTAEGILEKDLLLEGSKIKDLWERERPLPEGRLQVTDLTDCLIFPGIIDAHTHYQLYSRAVVTADTFASGSRSAAAGGVTTFIDYVPHPESGPLSQGLEERMAEAEGSSILDFSFHQNLYFFHETIPSQLQVIKEMGINSIKIFTTYRQEGYLFPLSSLQDLCRHLQELELLLTVHAEDEVLITAREEEQKRKGPLTIAHHPHLRPSQAEARAIEKVAQVTTSQHLPLYIVHLSSQEGYQALEQVRKKGGRIYGETAPHYLLLTQDCLTHPHAPLFFMIPPLRERKDQGALWAGIKKGFIQVVATDHCAFHITEKMLSTSPLAVLPGIPGSETLLPLMHHFGVRQEGLDYPQLVNLLSTAPAKIFGLYPQKGSLLPGTDADLVIFHPEKEVTLQGKDLHSRAGYTPYEGIRVKGYPLSTYRRGEIIYEQGTFPTPGGGRFIPAGTSSLYG